jgi:hypothetical protein
MSSSNREKSNQNLLASASRRSQEAEAKARRAIMAMKAKNVRVDFPSVASEAHVSTDFLYGHAELRAEIVSLRKAPPPRIEVKTSTTKSRDASNAVKLAVATQAIQELRQENQALREENARLHGDLMSLRRSPRRNQ